MNAYEFIIRLRDQATGGLRQLAASVGVTRNRVRELDDDMVRMNRTSGLLGTGLSALKGAFRFGGWCVFIGINQSDY